MCPSRICSGYVIEQTNLQYTVEDYAVYLRPSIDEGETLSGPYLPGPAQLLFRIVSLQGLLVAKYDGCRCPDDS